MEDTNIKIRKAKLPSSNYSIADQKKSIEKTINLLKPKKRKILFLGKPYDVLASTEFSILRKIKGQSNIRKKLLAPKVMLSSRVLKEIFLKLEKLPLNRIFIVTIRADKTILIHDRLNQDKTILKNCVLAGGNNVLTFKLDSRMFFFFKLNMKTITSKCNLYVSKNFIVYENGRGKSEDTELYLMPRRKKTVEVKNEKANYNDFSFFSAAV